MLPRVSHSIKTSITIILLGEDFCWILSTLFLNLYSGWLMSFTLYDIQFIYSVKNYPQNLAA